MDTISKRAQTFKEELANSLTHGLGILFGIVAICLMISLSVISGGSIQILSTALFGSALLLMYTCSTLYHAVQHEKTKSLLRIFDHISIYILIAGTYTPFLLLGIKGMYGWVLFIIIWVIALFGIFFKVFFTHRFPKLSLVLYLLMGWVAIFMGQTLYETLDRAVLILLVAGGFSYTIGTFFYIQKRMLYAHAIWHIFVLSGTSVHFVAVLLLL